MYYNYHAMVRKKLLEGKLTGYEFCEEYHGISPALVLYFGEEKPMPIRDHMWERYLPFLIEFEEKQ